jgi:hypothetical protein
MISSPSLRINFGKKLDTNVSTLKIKQQAPPKNQPKTPTMTTEYETNKKSLKITLFLKSDVEFDV